MKILLTVFGVYNTLENIDDEVFKEIIDKIKQVKEINNDDVILISFCDNTENKDIFMYYLRNITDDNEILIGRQYLNNVYYNDILKSGALLYNDKLSKEEKVYNYVKEFIENKNKIDLYYIDNNIDTDTSAIKWTAKLVGKYTSAYTGGQGLLIGATTDKKYCRGGLL